MFRLVVLILCNLAAVALLDMLLVGRNPRTVLAVLVGIVALLVVAIVYWAATMMPPPELVTSLIISGVMLGNLFMRIYHRAVESYDQRESR